MALSGKAPAPEPMLEDELAAWGVAGAGAGGGGAGAGGAEGAAAPGAAGRAAASRRWSVAFHSEFNMAGVQPTLLVPQVRGEWVEGPEWAGEGWGDEGWSPKGQGLTALGGAGGQQTPLVPRVGSGG